MKFNASTFGWSAFRIVMGIAVVLSILSMALGETAAPGENPAKAKENSLVFNVDDSGSPKHACPKVKPWKVVRLEPDYGGLWLVAGDLDGDGEVEIVSAENVNVGDVHYTSAMAAQKLDGTVMWRWGDPDAGRKKWGHDVACQIHDWDGDGRLEVVALAQGALVELDGATGREKRRIAIERDATDCVTFCDVSGKGWRSDVLVKDRYHRIWAYNQKGELLWYVRDPGGYRTAHQPRPIDLDGDGRDEIWAGYAMLNHDGSVRWVYESKTVDLKRGHMDCGRVFRLAKDPRDTRLVLTCCGANNVAMVDGNGRTIWEVAGHHFESVDVGSFLPGGGAPQIVVDVDHRPYGEGPVWVLDEAGAQVAFLNTNYARHHALLDWDGDGLAEILVANSRGAYNHEGRRIRTFELPGEDPPKAQRGYERSLLLGDMTGDGVEDVMLVSPEEVCIYKNPNPGKKKGTAPLGTETNLTLY